MSEENVSLPVAQALASALAKIEAYVPTEYVDNSEPDLDAEHLNHAEQGIMRVTNLLNAAVDVIQGQQSRLADAENKIGADALTGGMTDLSSGLNKLDSGLNNMWSLSGNQTLIPNNSDMHTYLTPGNYYCASNTNAETLKNSPLKFAFTMKVYLSVGIGSQYLIQEYTKYDASERILVYYDGNRNIWTSYHVQLEKMV